MSIMNGRRGVALTLLPASLAVSAPAAPSRVDEYFPRVPLCAEPPVDEPGSDRPILPVDGPMGPGATRTVPVPIILFDPEDDLSTITWRGLLADPVTPEIPLVVREGTVGLTVRAAASESLLVSVELLSPDGSVLSCDDCVDAPAASEVRKGRGTAQMPSTDRPGWELVSGRYAFRVRVLPLPTRADEPVMLDAVVRLRTNRAVTVEHLLDLNFVYLPGSTLSEEIATTHPHFAALLDTIDDYLAPTGIRIDRVTHVDLDRPEFSAIGTWEEAGNMFRTSRRIGRTRALNVYCVEKFVAPLNPVVGLSGGIPGPAGNGTRDSGIAVRMSPFFACPDCLPAFGSLFAHEIGHYLGFYHTSETDLESWDPFSDTPRCLQGGLGDCPDYDYVMFPVIHSANTVWSPAQVGVAVTHPLVRTVAVVGAEGVADSRRVTAGLTLVPNPFRREVRIEWEERSEGPAAIVGVYDVTGRLVRSLGGHVGLSWDGRDAAGRPVASGTYFLRVGSGDVMYTGRAVRLE